jgi:hypothetical protein
MGVNQRYNIKVNPPKPTDKEVLEHKNFDRILSQYNRTAKRKPLHDSLNKTNKMFPVVIVAILIILIVFYYDRFKSNKKEQLEKEKIEQVESEGFDNSNSIHFEWKTLRV